MSEHKPHNAGCRHACAVDLETTRIQLAAAQERVEEYKREVERREEIISGQDMAVEAAHAERDMHWKAKVQRLEDAATYALKKAAEWHARVDELERLLGESRAEAREARSKALADFIGVLFEECQPNNGDLFSRMDDRIRALSKGTDNG